MLVRLLAAAAFMAALLPFSQAMAEPQILALLNTERATPLTCSGTECYAQLSAFCMEPGRAGPDHESPYSLAEGAALSLVVTESSGAIRRLDAAPYAQFSSQRGYAAVRISIPRETLAAINAQKISVEVGPRVVLLPIAQPNYHRDHEPAQIAAALGPNRTIGDRLVDNGGEKAAAARYLSHLINALPEKDVVSRATREGAWQHASALASDNVRRHGQDIAEGIFKNCLVAAEKDDLFTFRHCLQRGHDRTLWFLNSDYWKAVGPQS